MDLVVLLARIFLVLVFAVAGAAKLADRAGAQQAVREFGVPESLAPLAGLLLPLAELAVAAALLSGAFTWPGALGALALLALFSGAIALSLARGRTPDCHCFGEVHSAPISGWTLARNAMFGLAALFLVLQGPGGIMANAADAFLALDTTEQVVLVEGVVLLAAFGAMARLRGQMLAQREEMQARLERIEGRLAARAVSPTSAREKAEPLPAGVAPAARPEQPSPAVRPPAPAAASARPAAPREPARAAPSAPAPTVGAPAPEFRLPTVDGAEMTLDALLAPELPVLLLFADPQCGPCTALLPDVARWQRAYADRLTIAVIARGGAEANRAKRDEHGLPYVLLQEKNEVSDLYQAWGTPTAVLVRADGTIGSDVVSGSVAITALVSEVVGEPVASAA